MALGSSILGSLIEGDFNGDDKLDLVATNDIGGVSILKGNGNGSFQPAVNYTAAPISNETFLAKGDFNNDGKLDLVEANSSGVYILIGNGNGTFRPAVQYNTQVNGGSHSSIATGDFNGDGNIDIVGVTYGGGTASSIFTMIGYGNGDFYQIVSSVPTGRYPTSITTGDFNGDGSLDLAMGYDEGDRVGIMLGIGSGAFRPTVYIGDVRNSGDLFVAAHDINGDEQLDLIVSSYGQAAPSLSVFSGRGKDIVLENLAKEAVYLDGPDVNNDNLADHAWKKNDTITFHGISLPYSVSAVFENNSTGFYALGLVSSTQQPVLVVRGTEPNTIADILADLNWSGVGISQFNSVWNLPGYDPDHDPKDWLDQERGLGYLPVLTGHSLGGAIVQDMAAAYTHDTAGSGVILDRVVTFNSPGIGQTIANEFKPARVAHGVMHYISNGDMVSLAGVKFLAGAYTLVSYAVKDLQWGVGAPGNAIEAVLLGKHLAPMLASSIFGISIDTDDITRQVFVDVNGVDRLNSALFTYSDSDYGRLVGLIAAVNQSLAKYLLTRDGVEKLRTTAGLGVIVLADAIQKTINQGWTLTKFISLPYVFWSPYIIALCPVDLVVTDAAGRTISNAGSTIPDALYIDDDFDGNGTTDHAVFIYNPVPGQLQISVIPQAGADPADTFSLQTVQGDEVQVLATNVPVGATSQDYQVNEDVAPPEASLWYGATEIPIGEDTPSDVTGTTFGSIYAGTGVVTRTFTIKNTGQTDLLTGPIQLPEGFSLEEALDAIIPVGDSDSFTVRLDDDHSGFYGGDISFGTSDPLASTVQFAISGTVLATTNVLLPRGKFTFTDADGSTVTVSYGGKVGSATIARDVPNGQAGDIGSITITGSDTKSSLTISVKGGADQGQTNVGQITDDAPLGTLNGKGVNLLGDLSIAGLLKTLVLNNVVGVGHTMTLGGASSDKGASLTFNAVRDLILTSTSPIQSLTVADWLDTDDQADALTAPSLGKLTSKGDFAAALHLTAANGGSSKVPTLNSVNILGTVNSGDWDIAGAINTLTVKRWLGGQITAASLNKLTTTGLTGVGAFAGDFDADLTLTGAGVLANKPALGAAAIKGSLAGDTWDITGAVGTLAVTGTLGTVGQAFTLKDVTNLATLTVGDVTNATVDMSGALKTLTAKRWLDGSITAASLASLKTTGQTGVGAFSGDFDADVTLSGSGIAAGKPVLGAAAISGALDDSAWDITGAVGTLSAALATGWLADVGNLATLKLTSTATSDLTLMANLVSSFVVTGNLADTQITLSQGVDAKLKALGAFTVTGTVTDTTVRSAGNVGAVKAAKFDHVLFFAGVKDTVTSLPATPDDFVTTTALDLPTIASLTLTGLKGQTTGPVLTASDIAAGKIGTISLPTRADAVTTDNAGDRFGFAVRLPVTKSTGPASLDDYVSGTDALVS